MATEDTSIGERVADAFLAAFGKAADAAIDLKVYEKTGGAGLPQTITSNQQLTRTVPGPSTVATAAAQPAWLQWAPLVAGGALVLFIVVRLAKR